MTITISTIAQKGGVGKTTTSVGLAIESERRGFKTMFIDFDSQSSGSSSFATPEQLSNSTNSYDFLSLEGEINPFVVSDNLHLLHANIDLIQLENEDFNSYFSLKEQCIKHLSRYDLIIIDTPGTLKTTVIAALTASDYYYSPLELSAYSLKAFKDVQETVTKVQERLNPSLEFLGFVLNRVHGLRFVDNELVPNQLSEREDYVNYFKDSGAVLSMISERSAVRANTQVANVLDVKDPSSGELLAFCDAVFNKIGILDGR